MNLFLASSSYEDRRYWEDYYAELSNKAVGNDAHLIDGDDALKDFDDKILNAVVGRKVLDLGCGDGSFTLKVGSLSEYAVGIDFSHYALRLASSKLSTSQKRNVEFLVASAEFLPFQECAFDLIVSREGPLSFGPKSLNQAHLVLSEGGQAMEISPGEKDKQSVLSILANGQSVQAKGKIIFWKARLFREAGFQTLKMNEYIAVEIFPDEESLFRDLARLPAIPDYNSSGIGEDLRQKMKGTLQTARGIETENHRVILVATR